VSVEALGTLDPTPLGMASPQYLENSFHGIPKYWFVTPAARFGIDSAQDDLP
jgi:hypothetical protein